MNKSRWLVIPAIVCVGVAASTYVLSDSTFPELSSAAASQEMANAMEPQIAAVITALPKQEGFAEHAVSAATPRPESSPTRPQEPFRSAAQSHMTFGNEAPQVSAAEWSEPGVRTAPGMQLHLSPGVREPIAWLTPVQALTDAQVAAVEDISERFIERVDDASALPDEDLGDVWEASQADADSLYRILFGDVAYNQRLMEAAIQDLDSI